jgi:hypothetical protein
MTLANKQLDDARLSDGPGLRPMSPQAFVAILASVQGGRRRRIVTTGVPLSM